MSTSAASRAADAEPVPSSAARLAIGQLALERCARSSHGGSAALPSVSRLVDEEPRPVGRDLDAARRPASGSRSTGSTCGPARASAAGRPRRAARATGAAPRRAPTRQAMWCVVPAPISAASSIGSANESGASSANRPAYRSGLPITTTSCRRGVSPGLEAQPQPVRILQLDRLADVRRLEPDRLERPAAEPALPGARPLEERDQRPGSPDLVAEVEVVAVRVVEVDRLLDEREAELAVEVERLLRVRADARHVVEARELHRRGA